jgi:hypothetical protein
MLGAPFKPPFGLGGLMALYVSHPRGRPKQPGPYPRFLPGRLFFAFCLPLRSTLFLGGM